MSFLLHFSGPAAFEQTVALKPATPAVVVGRDKEAAVYLPDTERLVSRRHLSIAWSEAGARLQVLSGNGINTDHGDYFSGDEVVLADGESARIGSYSLIVSAEPAAVDLDATSFSGMGTRPVPAGPVTLSAPEKDTAAAATDPWAELLSQHAPKPAPQAAPTPPAAAAPVADSAPPSSGLVPDDPFSSSTSWRLADDMAGPDPFSISFVGRSGVDIPMDAPPAPAPSAGAAPSFDRTQVGDTTLQALCRGLGVPPPAGDADFDWETFGASVRHVVQCLGDHLGSRLGARRDMRAEDRTLLGARENNPLKGGLPLQEMLQYLLFTPDGVGSYAPARKALQEVADDARSHEASLRTAARGLAEGAIREFDPAKLRGTLLKGRISMTALVDNARLWDLYTAHYEKKSQQLPEWTEQLFNRYYMAAYLREVEKLRRARLPPAAQRTE
ncbi:type VI secretion system-associated FHA domain protein TagH [Ramlibacter tataouinensis]|uniref:type VI secretion system-associated FHA domain protein TagH n=1 Tax=Ramlibacter tataouinensis TaxID=94132 RepID=UPI0022F3DC44|nr:type VI secretion system-associated FHA domain protein TagH [Ramlibacter tataouinensis]WBY01938.1 type VI secretion system-associated FHA domain protein TagH [Ramlibacter tataouinensis]